MSGHGSFLSAEQFQCSICLDVFINPSSTPCGHSFCMRCISRYWDTSKVCQCPLCKRTFQKRPDLQINRTLREITEQFKSMRGGGGLVRKKGAGSRGRGMDGLLDELKKKLPRPPPKVPARRRSECQGEPIPQLFSAITPSLASSVPNQSPLAALIHSFKPPQQPPHFPHSNSRRRFTVIGAASGQDLPICEVHQRGILIYCITDQVCICPECETEDHPDHDTVPIEDKWMEIKAQLSVSEQEIQEMIGERIMKMEEIRMSLAELEAEMMEVMEMNRRAAMHQADTMMRQLELEVKELRRRESALAELAQSDDFVSCIKTFPTLSSPPLAKDWSATSVNSDLGTATIYRALAAEMARFQEELNTTAQTGLPASVPECPPLRAQPRMKTVQEYAMDVTLDPNTAHPRLIMSEDMKSVWCVDRNQLLPDNPERFDRVMCVLGRERISSGKHYWEVEVVGKTDWDLGVARKSVNRKGKVEVTPSNGYWFLSLRDKNKCAFRTDPSTDVPLNLQPNKIGIFVDFENGQVSFYNIDARIHIYTFNDSFSESIYPFFSPCSNKCGKNDAPLTITPVIMTEWQ